MEYASGGDLLDYINARSRRGIGIGEELAKRLFRQLAEGVAHCHRRNVVHRLFTLWYVEDMKKLNTESTRNEAEKYGDMELKNTLGDTEEAMNDLP